MKIKICGLRTPGDANVVNEAMPDYIGFVFAKSHRQVSIETAKKLKNRFVLQRAETVEAPFR